MSVERTPLADDERRPPSASRNGPVSSTSVHRSTAVDGSGARPARGRHSKARWIAGIVGAIFIIGLAIGIYFHLHKDRLEDFSASGVGGKSGASGGGHTRGGPPNVVTEIARTGDLPIYLDALGTVTPLNFVTVKSRVDGQIDTIAFVEGQTIKQGDLLAQIDPRPFQVQLEQAQGQLARDQATLNNAQVELDRDLRAGDAIPKQQVDTQRAAVDTGAAALKIDQAAIDSAKLQLDYCRITAPISGVVGLRTVDQGNIVHASDTTGVAVIAQVQPITVVFSLSEDRLPAVLKQMTGGKPLPAEAFGRDLTTKLATGKLTALDNQIDATTGMVRLKAEFANEDRALYPSQFVNVRLLIDTLKDAVLVPAAAIQRGPDSSFVYLLDAKDQTVHVRPVKLGASEGEQTVIQSGVEAGDVLVTDGVDKLQDGSKVNVRTSAGNASKANGGGDEAGNSTTSPSGHGRSHGKSGAERAS